jgi:hypothetical protein
MNGLGEGEADVRVSVTRAFGWLPKDAAARTTEHQHQEDGHGTFDREIVWTAWAGRLGTVRITDRLVFW